MTKIEKEIKIEKEVFSRFFPRNGSERSGKLKVGVVGAGPGGLLLAWKLLDAGHQLTVFEKRESYARKPPSDARSYNLTADGLGIRAFGRLANLIYWAGVVVDGRAIHPPSETLWTHPYGHRSSDYLVSIPRRDLLALLSATIVDHSNCELKFGCEVTNTNTLKGTITSKDSGNNVVEKYEGFDLIVFSDGVKGMGPNKARKYGADIHLKNKETPYLVTTIDANSVSSSNLELNKIHFFPCADSVGIGLPNYDGTISLLIEGQMHKNSKGQLICPFTGRIPFSYDKTVFDNIEKAQRYLDDQNPKLAHILQNRTKQIVNKRPERFIEAYVSNWRIGNLGVLLGDAGSCAPPWAGFGMNLACSHADDLARLIEQSKDLDTALTQYNYRRVECTKVVQRIIDQHGELLNSGMGRQTWRQNQALQSRREQILGERSEYQIVAFEDQGLDMLAGLV